VSKKATLPYHVAHLCEDGSLDTENITGHNSYAEARAFAEKEARYYTQRKLVVLATKETVWTEPAIHDDLVKPGV
jgi:hypothetical protein